VCAAFDTAPVKSRLLASRGHAIEPLAQRRGAVDDLLLRLPHALVSNVANELQHDLR
jgi:hypothetical protein